MTIDLNAIRLRAEAAVAGPWKVTNENEGTEYLPFWVIGGDDAEKGEWFAELHVGHKDDATFIAKARNDVPDLLAEVERLSKQVSDLICAIYEHAREGSELMEVAEEADRSGEA